VIYKNNGREINEDEKIMAERRCHWWKRKIVTRKLEVCERV
jgi:hypothetical protein